MSDRGAYRDEMRLQRELSDGDVERLLSGLAPVERDEEVEEVAAFVRAMAAAVPETPQASIGAALVPHLAQTAAAGQSAGARPWPRRGRRPLGTALRVGVAAALLPVFLAGIAVAGVKLPGPAEDAFQSVGIDLPNQAGGDQSGQDAGNQAGGAQSGKGEGDSPEQGGAGSQQGEGQGNGGGAAKRSHRQANGPSGATRANPPGNAVRRGPNPTPGTPRGKPVNPPHPSPPTSNAGGQVNGSAVGQTHRRGPDKG